MNANAHNFDPMQQQQQQQYQGQQEMYTSYDASAYYEHPASVVTHSTTAMPDQNYGMMYNHNADVTADTYGEGGEGYYPHQQQQQQLQNYTLPLTEDPNNLQSYIDSVPAGCYYPVQDLQPQIYGAPVSAIAADDSFHGIYVASETQSLGTGRRWGQNHHDSRASMLVLHSTTDGSLYSSVAGHPEAPSQVLTAIYESIYLGTGIKKTASIATARQQHRTIPSHAYRPPYGATSAVTERSSSGQYHYHLGIRTLLPSQGYVASVSPSAVRLHSHGGLQVTERNIEGMLCGTASPTRASNVLFDGSNGDGSDGGGVMTHLCVGGLALAGKIDANRPSKTGNIGNNKHVLCMDMWQGLRTVSSYTLKSNNSSSRSLIGVTCMATSHSKGSCIVGCSDGQMHLLDTRLRELAQIKGHHAGGVVNVAVSADGMLLATTGFGSKTTATNVSATLASLYGFPDPAVFLYDIRYLGRGGIRHPFAGMRGGPRYLSFLPDVDNQPPNRLAVASGQAGGGLQIMVPFQSQSDVATEAAANFLLPSLQRGESLTAMSVSKENLALGTSQGRVLQYRVDGYNNRNKCRVEKETLVTPPFEPSIPAVSLECTLLMQPVTNSNDATTRPGMNDKAKSIFSTYVLSSDPTITPIGNPRHESLTSFGHLASDTVTAPSRLQVSAELLKSKTLQTVDFMQTIPTAELNIDLFDDHRTTRTTGRMGKRMQVEPISNPNKFLYANKLFRLSYEKGLNISNRTRKQNRRDDWEESGDDADDFISIPPRYRLTLRPTHKSAASFNHAESNQTGLLPGWDYPPTMPNAFVPPVLLLLYFTREVRSSVLEAQFKDRFLSKTGDRSLAPELGFLYHRIEDLARFACTFPVTQGESTSIARLQAWAPSNFISCLTSMPEAEQLQILDGSPAAVDMPRRPEAFYRFLLYQLDKELTNDNGSRLMDPLGGIDFSSINEFISGSGAPSITSTRSLSVDLSYEPFVNGVKDGEKKDVAFCNVLQHTLCRETSLRAWNQNSKSYETIIQRKIATSLPTILSLSCACAGRKEEEGLTFWRGPLNHSDNQQHWLPEIIEIELEETGLVVVRELVCGGKMTNGETSEWRECNGSGKIPSAITDIVARHKVGDSSVIRKRRYRLDAVLSLVRDDFDRNCPQEVIASLGGGEGAAFGHHVLHARVPSDYKEHIMNQQREELLKLQPDAFPGAGDDEDLTTFWACSSNATETLEKRLAQLDKIRQTPKKNDWVLANGYVVSDTVVEDARAFHVKFKEPSLVVFRAVEAGDLNTHENALTKISTTYASIPEDVIRTLSLTNGSMSLYAANQKLSELPGKGDLVAFDAEFVSVQEEESTLTEAGSKVTVRETRHALARISVIDCQSRNVLFDDYVLPREPVVDYLTRFSGVVSKDLDLKESGRHLIDPRAAYLKLRCLRDRGCIFCGHGLKQDFWTSNLAIKTTQIIDTLEIYHKPAQRYISLRFLTNFVLKRDMQQDVHDSVEDAMAAYELYLYAVELKKKGEFEQLLDSLYSYGQKTDWKLGVDEDNR